MPLFLSTVHLQLLGFERGVDGQRLEGAQQLASHGGVDSLAAEAHAASHSERLILTLASIHGLRIAPGVRDRQAPPAASAHQQTCEQCASAATRLRATSFTVRVGRQLPLVALELLPVDVSLVMPLEQHLPLIAGAPMAVGLASAAVDDLRAMLTLSVGVDTCVERILEHRDDVAIADRMPLEADELLAVGGPGETDLVRDQRQMCPARAAEFGEPREDQADRLLQASVRIHGQAVLAIPVVSDRHADAQLTAPSHRAGGIVHAGTKHTELELADASLHPQQQSVVRSTRIIDAVHVDDASLHQAA